MPRFMRIEYPGAIYHVMSRGNRREPIFMDEGDRHDFLKTLAEACLKIKQAALVVLFSVGDEVDAPIVSVTEETDSVQILTSNSPLQAKARNQGGSPSILL